MIKRLLCTMALLLAPALASADMVSISDLRGQAEQMGRWQQTYEAYGRTIEVDIPIIVPQVDRCPIVAVEGRKPWSMDELRALLPRSKSCADDDRMYAYTLTGEEKGAAEKAGNTVTFYDPDEVGMMLSIQYNETHDADVPNTMKEYERYFPWQLDEQTAYAEDNPATFAKALECAHRIGEWLYPAEECGIHINDVTVWDRRRLYKGSNYEATGDPVEGSTIGKYSLSCSQTLYGIPLAKTVRFNLNPFSFALAVGDHDVFPGISIDYLSDDAFDFISYGTFLPREVRCADVPLAPLDSVISSIESEIEAGHVRAVYALGLEYLLCEDAKGEFLVYPAWIMKGLYVSNPKDELTAKFGSAGHHFDDPFEYGCYPVFAQTAEFGSPEILRQMNRSDDGRGQRLILPEIITWEEI